MHALARDLRYAVRLILRRPMLASVTVLTLAIGVGGNAAIFSVVNGLLLRPLPVPEPDRLVRIFGTREGDRFDVLSFPNLSDVAARSTTLSALAIHQQTTAAWGMGDQTESARVELVSGNYFTTYSVTPALGRALSPTDDQLEQPSHVAVVSDAWWQSRLGGAADVIDRTVHINGAPFRIIGVMPATFHGSYDALRTDVWVPLMTYGTVRPRENRITNRGWGWMYASGRLAAGASVPQAQAEMDRIAADLRTEYPGNNRALGLSVVRAATLPEPMRPLLERVLFFSLIVVGLALIAACANIANAQLATVIARQQEIAVRLAVGATRLRIARQWLTESLILAATATAAGVIGALWTRDAIQALASRATGLANFEPSLPMDWRLLAFATLVAALVTMLFGGLPAWRAAKTSLSEPLKEDGVTTTGGVRRGWAQGALVVVQVAVSLALLASASMLAKSIASARAFDVGFDTSNLLVATPQTNGLGFDPARGRAYFRDALARVRSLPGVTGATLALVVPLGGSEEGIGVLIDGYTPPGDRPYVSIANNIVAPGYFELMGIPLVAGRRFVAADGDDHAARVAIVNETFARRYFAGANPIGRTLRFGTEETPTQIVGIVGDITYYEIGEEPRPYLYLPFGPFSMDFMTIQARTAGADPSLPRAIRRELRAANPRVMVETVVSYEELRQAPLYPGRLMAGISAIFGGLALLLTLVGLYGVVMYAVSTKAREFAVRMALGARPADILTRVLRQGLLLAGIGVGCGVAVAFALARLFRRFLFGVSTIDPVTLVACATVLLALAFVAAYLPARRATRIDPAAALTGRH